MYVSFWPEADFLSHFIPCINFNNAIKLSLSKDTLIESSKVHTDRLTKMQRMIRATFEISNSLQQ